MGAFNAPYLEEIRKDREVFLRSYLLFALVICLAIGVLYWAGIRPAIELKRAQNQASEASHQAFTARLIGDDKRIVGVDEPRTFTLFVCYTGASSHYVGNRGADGRFVQFQGGDGGFDILKFRRQVAELEATGMKLDESSVAMERYPDGTFIIGKLAKR